MDSFWQVVVLQIHTKSQRVSSSWPRTCDVCVCPPFASDVLDRVCALTALFFECLAQRITGGFFPKAAFNGKPPRASVYSILCKRFCCVMFTYGIVVPLARVRSRFRVQRLQEDADAYRRHPAEAPRGAQGVPRVSCLPVCLLGLYDRVFDFLDSLEQFQICQSLHEALKALLIYFSCLVM